MWGQEGTGEDGSEPWAQVMGPGLGDRPSQEDGVQPGHTGVWSPGTMQNGARLPTMLSGLDSEGPGQQGCGLSKSWERGCRGRRLLGEEGCVRQEAMPQGVGRGW